MQPGNMDLNIKQPFQGQISIKKGNITIQQGLSDQFHCDETNGTAIIDSLSLLKVVYNILINFDLIIEAYKIQHLAFF